MTAAHWRLPDKATLEQEYRAGASYSELGEKYGVHPKSVYNTMVRRARAAGTTWPLKQGRPGWQASKVRARQRRLDSITTVMIRAEIQEMRTQPWRILLADLAKESGISYGTVMQISSGHRQRCQRSTAEAIMAVIERHEKAYRRKATAQHALDCRRRKIAAEKAAGVRPPSQMDLIRARRNAA